MRGHCSHHRSLILNREKELYPLLSSFGSVFLYIRDKNQSFTLLSLKKEVDDEESTKLEFY